MNNKTLISKLNNLKGIGPDKVWLESNREILFNQISNSGAKEITSFGSFVINFQSLMKTVSQPALALAVFVFVLVGGSVFSHQAFSKAQPNDSLYIARIISEKAKLTTVLNQEDRDRLAIQFASNHAQDISATLANPEFASADEVVVAKLNKDLKKEISTVKDRITRLPAKVEKVEPLVEEEIHIAVDMTDEAAIEIYEGAQKEVTPVVIEEEASEEPIITEEPIIAEEPVVKKGTNQIMKELEKASEDMDYGLVHDKLNELGESIK